jgi:hypothetical protein
MFEKLTRAQHAIMGALLESDLAADHIKPATLGALCAKGLVNVKDGVVMGVGMMYYDMWKKFGAPGRKI